MSTAVISRAQKNTGSTHCFETLKYSFSSEGRVWNACLCILIIICCFSTKKEKQGINLSCSTHRARAVLTHISLALSNHGKFMSVTKCSGLTPGSLQNWNKDSQEPTKWRKVRYLQHLRNMQELFPIAVASWIEEEGGCVGRSTFHTGNNSRVAWFPLFPLLFHAVLPVTWHPSPSLSTLPQCLS